MALGLGAINSPNGGLVKGGSTGLGNGLGRPAWAHFGPVNGLLCLVLLPESSRAFPFCMWSLVVSFSSDRMKLLVPQDSVVF
jgi:hypothetical protein